METVSRIDPEAAVHLPDPDPREILRYMGYRGNPPGSELLGEIGECVRDLQKAVTPRYVYERFPLGRKKREEEGWGASSPTGGAGGWGGGGGAAPSE